LASTAASSCPIAKASSSLATKGPSWAIADS